MSILCPATLLSCPISILSCFCPVSLLSCPPSVLSLFCPVPLLFCSLSVLSLFCPVPLLFCPPPSFQPNTRASRLLLCGRHSQAWEFSSCLGAIVSLQGCSFGALQGFGWLAFLPFGDRLDLFCGSWSSGGSLWILTRLFRTRQIYFGPLAPPL